MYLVILPRSNKDSEDFFLIRQNHDKFAEKINIRMLNVQINLSNIIVDHNSVNLATKDVVADTHPSTFITYKCQGTHDANPCVIQGEYE